MARRLMRSGLLSILMLAIPPAWAEDPVFSISAYDITGNTLLPESVLEPTVSPFIGDEKNFETIQQALKALEKKYADAGYGAVRVMLPEQEIEDGRIKLTVVEARIGQVTVEGNKHFSTENIRRSIPGLREGEIPMMDDISASLRVSNENAAKLTSLVFKPSAQEKSIDATLRVVDEDPVKFGISMDNTGSQTSGKYLTGRYRVGLVAQHMNLFDRDHIVSAQIITSPGHEDDVRIIGIGYKIPIHATGHSIDLSYGYSNVSSAGNLNLGSGLNVGGNFLGAGKIFSAKYNTYLPSIGDWEHRLSAGIDFKSFENNSEIDGTNVMDSKLKLRPLSLTYGANLRKDGFSFGSYVTFMHNLRGGEHGRTRDFRDPDTSSRENAPAHYSIWRYGANLAWALPSDWMLSARISGQYTKDKLVPYEGFGIGGADTVRGFQEREESNDKGMYGSLELHTPDFSKAIGLQDARANALLFYDAGRTRRNKALPGEERGESMASAGLGLRFTISRNVSIKLDGAVVTQDGGTQKRGDTRGHGSVLWFF